LDSVCEQSIGLYGPEVRSKADFEVFVKQHMKAAYATALGLVGNREDALELSQEAFYRAYRHYDQLNTKGKLFPWFYQILRNLCFSHLRKRRVRRAYEAPHAEAGGPAPEGGSPDPVGQPPPAGVEAESPDLTHSAGESSPPRAGPPGGAPQKGGQMR